jgi:hypothetical protein
VCGVETWTLREEDQNYLEISEMWCWRRTEKIIWTVPVKKKKKITLIKGISYIE